MSKNKPHQIYAAYPTRTIVTTRRLRTCPQGAAAQSEEAGAHQESVASNLETLPVSASHHMHSALTPNPR